MRELFEKSNINISDSAYEKFENYFDILTFYNNKFNITAIIDKKEVFIKNFIDSIIFADKIFGKSLIDIGSGGGFPAMCIKIVRDDIDVTMLEATGKKCEFLKVVSKELDLKNVTVINGRAEEYALKPSFREKYDCVTARAVASLNILSEYCLPFIKIGGKFIAYKGKASEEILKAQNAINTLGGKIVEKDEIDLFGNTRTAVVVEKIKNTPIIYPRSNGKIRKTPL